MARHCESRAITRLGGVLVDVGQFPHELGRQTLRLMSPHVPAQGCALISTCKAYRFLARWTAAPRAPVPFTDDDEGVPGMARVGSRTDTPHGVLVVGNRLKVLRVDATPVAADTARAGEVQGVTQVVGFHAFWELSVVGQHPREAVCALTDATHGPEYAVATIVDAARPQPAGTTLGVPCDEWTGLVDQRPKVRQRRTHPNPEGSTVLRVAVPPEPHVVRLTQTFAVSTAGTSRDRTRSIAHAGISEKGVCG